MVNLLFHHSAIDVIGSESLRNLCDSRRHHDPIRLDVRNVVEHQTRHRYVSKIVKASRRPDVLQPRIVRMKSERNVRNETVCLILQIAEPHKMVDTIFRRVFGA